MKLQASDYVEINFRRLFTKLFSLSLLLTDVKIVCKTTKVGMIIFLAFILTLAPLQVAWGAPLNLTITTSKQTYSPGDRILINGNLTLNNNTVSDGLVAVQVNDPKGNFLIMRTRPTGTNITKSWFVDILSIVPVRNGLGEPSYNFKRGDYVGFNVTIRNNEPSPHPVIVTVSIYYSNEVPLSALIMHNDTMAGRETVSVISYPLIRLPKDAPLGTAMVYASVLNPPLPKDRGFALSPEKTTSFTITSSTSSLSSENLTASTSYLVSTEGTYNLTFKVPSVNAKLGNYTIYATSFYPVGPYPYLASNSLTFRVILMGDINNDGKVDILDLAIVAKAFGSYPGYPNWNPIADVNGDLTVDITDLALVAVHYGKTGSY